MQNLERKQQKLASLQAARRYGIEVVRYGRERDRLDRANDGDRGASIVMLAEELNRALQQGIKGIRTRVLGKQQDPCWKISDRRGFQECRQAPVAQVSE